MFIRLVLILCLILCGCARVKQVIPIINFEKDPAAELGLSPYSGPKAELAMADFEVEAEEADFSAGSELRLLLAKALKDSNRFIIVDPKQEKAVSSDLSLTAVLLEFKPQTAGGRLGVGGAGAGNIVFGGLLGPVSNKAYLTLELKLVDNSNSKVLLINKIVGAASDFELSGVPFAGSIKLERGLSSYANTPMEKAIKFCITEAARYLAYSVPLDYFKHSGK